MRILVPLEVLKHVAKLVGEEAAVAEERRRAKDQKQNQKSDKTDNS